jgi:hypothetical protein
MSRLYVDVDRDRLRPEAVEVCPRLGDADPDHDGVWREPESERFEEVARFP